MEPLFKAAHRESAVDIVVNQIKSLLLEKKLKPGDKLPSEMELCEGLGVSRGSVREAMKILSAFGIVDVRIGNGTYIREAPNNTMIDSLLFGFLLTNPDTSELSEFRKLFEIDIVELIIQNFEHNAKERTELKDNLAELKKLREENAPVDLLSANDLAFHRIMGRASKNIITQRIYGFIIDFMQESIRTTHHVSKQHGELAAKSHQSIVNAIESKDIEICREAIIHSVNIWSQLQNNA